MKPSTRAVAYHEAGHAVIALLHGLAISAATIVPAGSTAGCVRQVQRFGSVDSTDLMVMLLAGAAAERKLTGKPATLDADDRDSARTLASVIVKAEPDSAAVEKHLAMYDVLADAGISQHWDWITRVASALQRKQTLDGHAIAGLM